jgi:hypothetical protein
VNGERGRAGEEAAPAGTPGPWRLYAGVALLSFCLVAVEVCLTRLFGWLLRYHFAFFAVSLALCGLGLGGYAAHLILRSRRVSEERLLLGAAYGVAVVSIVALLLVLLVVIPLEPTAYALVGFLLMLPFCCAGAVLAILFRRHAGVIGSLYAADLLGAALAAPGAVMLLNLLGPLDSMFLVAATAACVPPILVRPGRAMALGTAGLVIACAALVAINHRAPLSDLAIGERSLARLHAQLADATATDPGASAAAPSPAAAILKRLVIQLARSGGTSRIIHSEWDAFGRTDVVQTDGEPYWLWMWLDGDVPAPMMRFHGDYDELTYLRRHPASLPYRLRPLRSILSLGSGGGLDVLVARMRGAESVDAVEINPAVPRIMALPQFRDFHGGVYDLPGVRFHQTEGRSFLRQSGAHYDLIALSLTQAFTTGQVGTALMESYIHTLEACRDYYRHLGENGLVMMLSGDRTGILPIRWFLTCLEAVRLETGGTEDAALGHLMLLVSPAGWSPYDYVVLMSRNPFTEEEVRQAESLSQEMGAYEHVFLPGRESALGDSIRARGWHAVADETRTALPKMVHGMAPPNVSPATDESPYFFDVGFGAPAPLRHLLYFAIGLCVLVAATSGLAAGSSPERGAGAGAQAARGLLVFAAYFALLGAGFMLIEVGLIQRLLILLGSPTHTVALILLALLLGGALGARLDQRAERGGSADRTASPDRGAFPDRRARSCLAVGIAAILVSLVLPAVAEALLGAVYPVRLASGFALCAGLGVLMGVPFPAGVRAASRWRKDSVPFLWGVNGVTSVLGSVVAVIASKPLGTSRVVLIGGLAYLLAALWAKSFRAPA